MRSAREIIAATFTVVGIVLGISSLVPVVVLIVWAADRDYPIDHVQGRFDSWVSTDPPVARLRWTGTRNRLCLGDQTGWVFSDRIVPIEPRTLPLPNAHEYVGKGQVVWLEDLKIPHEAVITKEKNLFLSIRFVWECNPLQKYWPLVVNPPRINIPVPAPPPK